MADNLTEQDEVFTITLGNSGSNFRFYKTNAPKVYDGFGTFAIEKWGHANGTRFVLIDVEHETWQLQRYASGTYGAEKVSTSQFSADVKNVLWKKILGIKEQE